MQPLVLAPGAIAEAERVAPAPLSEMATVPARKELEGLAVVAEKLDQVAAATATAAARAGAAPAARRSGCEPSRHPPRTSRAEATAPTRTGGAAPPRSRPSGAPRCGRRCRASARRLALARR